MTQKPCEQTILFGPPGTGKTTQLIRLVEKALDAGYEPEEIAFVSFTKAAVNEAISRAQTRFNLSARRMPWFRTLHSLAFASVRASRDAVLQSWAEFGAEYSFSLSSRFSQDPTDARQSSADDVYLRAKGLADATGLGIDAIVREYGLTLSTLRYENFCERLTEWKRKHDKIEFSDMLTAFLAKNEPVPVRIAFVDEAQDLTPVQWRCIRVAFSGVERLYIAGDDDQAIYHWAGADVNPLLKMEARRIVLSQSHRVPRAIVGVYSGILDRIETRQPKEWRPAAHDGELRRNVDLGSLAIDPKEGSWMLLARTSMTLTGYARALEARGLPYRFNGADCFRDGLVEAYEGVARWRSGETLRAVEARAALRFADPSLRVSGARVGPGAVPLDREDLLFQKVPPAQRRFAQRCAERGTLRAPRVEVSTIHQAKGAEADNVFLSPDMSPASAGALRRPGTADPEHRVMYVGATRARRRLFLGRPMAENIYRMP